MDRLREFLLELPRRRKGYCRLLLACFLSGGALWLAFIVRLGIDDMYNPLKVHIWFFVCAPVVAIPLFIRFCMSRAVMRYFGNDALVAIVKAVSLSSLILAVVVYWYSIHESAVPRSIIFNYWWLILVIIRGLRLFMRQYFMGDRFTASQYVPFTSRDNGLTKVVIYGAGVAGNHIPLCAQGAVGGVVDRCGRR
jgi:FlaA1/EpsC-like NDP-sugar epimerase